MPSALFAVGYLLLVVVVSWLAYLSHIPEPYICGDPAWYRRRFGFRA